MEDNKQEDKNKVVKAYDANIKKLVALVGGSDKIKPSKKLPKDDVGDVISELFKEEREATREEIKNSIKETLKTKVAFDKAIAEEEMKLKKFKEGKMQEFNKSASALFQRIEGIGELESSYYEALKSVEE